MSEDLKERVHKCRMKHMVNGTAYLVGDLRREIAALRAENERLRADVSESRRKGHMNTKAAHEERDRANAENERLREALTSVMTWIDNWDPNFSQDDDWPADRDRARAALSGDIRAALPTETGTPLEKHGISEE